MGTSCEVVSGRLERLGLARGASTQADRIGSPRGEEDHGMGEEGAGHQMMIRKRYGGYYLDAGCADLIIRGEAGLLHFEQIDRFVEDGARLQDGSVKPADLVVLATGFDTQEVVIGRYLGEAVAKKVGPVWGIGPDGEMNNMWKRTPQQGLWFVGGSFAQCRNYSRYVGLQIKAIEEGLLGVRGQ